MPARLLSTLLVLWLASGTALADAPAPQKMLRDIEEQWSGAFDNHIQVRANLDRMGAKGPELSRERRQLKVVRIDAPQLGDRVLFFEEYRATQPGTANRQRVVSLVFDEKRQQVRARQLFFNGAKHGRALLDPAVVARMPPLLRPVVPLGGCTRTLSRGNGSGSLHLEGHERRRLLHRL